MCDVQFASCGGINAGLFPIRGATLSPATGCVALDARLIAGPGTPVMVGSVGLIEGGRDLPTKGGFVALVSVGWW